MARRMRAVVRGWLVWGAALLLVALHLSGTPVAAGPPASFALQQTFAVGGGPVSVAVADINGDGKPDLAVANFNDSTVSVLLNTTAANASTPTFAAQQAFATGARPLSVAVGDVNG